MTHLSLIYSLQILNINFIYPVKKQILKEPSFLDQPWFKKSRVAFSLFLKPFEGQNKDKKSSVQIRMSERIILKRFLHCREKNE